MYINKRFRLVSFMSSLNPGCIPPHLLKAVCSNRMAPWNMILKTAAISFPRDASSESDNAAYIAVEARERRGEARLVFPQQRDWEGEE
jgi:hypothetical protein